MRCDRTVAGYFLWTSPEKIRQHRFALPSKSGQHRYKWQPHSLKCSHNLQTHLLYHTECPHSELLLLPMLAAPWEKLHSLAAPEILHSTDSPWESAFHWQPLKFYILLYHDSVSGITLLNEYPRESCFTLYATFHRLYIQSWVRSISHSNNPNVKTK